MEGTVKVPVNALWATSASFKLHITASVCRILVSTKPLSAFPATHLHAARAPIVAIQGLSVSKSVSVAVRIPLASRYSPQTARTLLLPL